MALHEINERYDEYFDFRKAKKEDIDNLMSFIGKNWKKGHILGRDREFFEYEFADGEELHFILVFKKGTQEIVGHTGYMLYSEGEAVAGVMTMVLPDLPVPMVGIELLKRFMNMIPHRTLVSVGVNPTTMLPLVKKIFKMSTGKMEHFYMTAERQEYRIAQIFKPKAEKMELAKKPYQRIESFAELREKMDLSRRWENLPYKNEKYLKKRYFQHPVYRYQFFLVESAEQTSGLFIGREVDAEGERIFRMVDFIGDIRYLRDIGLVAGDLLKTGRYEYIDFMAGGLPEGAMSGSGFCRKEAEDGNVIPTYFEPFVQKNVDVWYEATGKTVVFKADADGDRPSIR